MRPARGARVAGGGAVVLVSALASLAASRHRRAPRRRRRAVVSTMASARRRGGCATLAPIDATFVPATASARGRMTRARRRHRRDAQAGGHVWSPPRERRRLDGVEVDVSSRWCRRTHTHEVAVVARAAAAHTTHNTRRRRTSKNTYQTQVRGRLLPPPPLPGQAAAGTRPGRGF